MQGERMCFKCGSEHARSAPTPSGHHYCPDCGNKWQETPALPSEPEVFDVDVIRADNAQLKTQLAADSSEPDSAPCEVPLGALRELSACVDNMLDYLDTLRARCAQLEGDAAEITNLRAFASAFRVAMCGGKGTEQSWGELGAYAAKMAEKYKPDVAFNAGITKAMHVCKSRSHSFDPASPEAREAMKCSIAIASHLKGDAARSATPTADTNQGEET